jgi:energy-coupling factor transporter ATP-binding protein EcfA2
LSCVAPQRGIDAARVGSQLQRLFVVLALVNRLELVFLDEMSTGLDQAARCEGLAPGRADA